MKSLAEKSDYTAQRSVAVRRPGRPTKPFTLIVTNPGMEPSKDALDAFADLITDYRLRDLREGMLLMTRLDAEFGVEVVEPDPVEIARLEIESQILELQMRLQSLRKA